MRSKYTRRQTLTLITFGLADFCNAICVSLQAPFFPKEAERKGATAAEYGFVFGIFELVVFLISPIYGKYMKVVGPKCLFHGGILLSSVCSILFGLLDLIDDHTAFIVSAFLIRIVEACGNAAFLISSFAIIASEFNDNISTTFATLETCFGLGLIAGPTLGGLLYDIGGYSLPFVTLGGLLFATALATKLILPSADIKSDTPNTGHLWEVMRIPGMPICAATICSTSMGISFLQATLEPHLRQFNPSAVWLGILFVVSGVAYALSATFWGWLCDSRLYPKQVSIMGAIITCVGISLVGPAPFLPLKTTLVIIVIGLVMHGLGIGARLVSSFADALKTAVLSGFPNNLETYGMVSGMWTSSFAFGAFIGPSVSGLLYDRMGFANASLFIIVVTAIMGVLEYLSYLKMKKLYRKGYTSIER